MRKLKFIGLGIVILFVVSLFSGTWYTIDQGERGVILRNGAMTGVAEPGFHLKIPFVDAVAKIPVTLQTSYWTCRELKHDNGDLYRDPNCSSIEKNEMLAYSQDQQPAALRVTVSWHAQPGDVVDIYANFSSLENLESRLIARRAPQAIKTVFGHYTAVSAVSERVQLNSEVLKAVEASVEGEPVIIDSVQIENIDYSDAYELSVEARMQAEVEVQKLQQKEKQAEVLARTTVVNAKATADARVAQAKAEADAIRLKGDAEADAIKARALALGTNPLLVELTKAEKWNGTLPTTMLPNGSIPMIGLDKVQ